MTSEPEFDREGIYIDRDLADEIAIEEELDANVVGPYLFPSPKRRRIAAWIYLVAGLVATFAIDGGWMLGIGFALIAAWHFLAAWDLNVDEDQALRVAGSVVPFAVGHSSASVRFVGWRSRPPLVSGDILGHRAARRASAGDRRRRER